MLKIEFTQCHVSLPVSLPQPPPPPPPIFPQAIPSFSERKSLFEQYVKNRAAEERKEKRVAHKAAVEGFKELLDDVTAAGVRDSKDEGQQG